MTKRIKRVWHKEFLKYMNFIVKHSNYEGMPEPYKKDGDIRWVTTVKSKIGQQRLEWWDKKRKSLEMEKGNAWISKVARAIHPTGEKPCQICGKTKSLDYIYPNKRGGKSPGAMSDAPDRYDGYHTYNSCCRSTQDTGRHKDNLNRYGEDRRAYENWSDGDWKAASWLMKEFNKHNLSPDHIGPISLGFAHRPKFNPLTAAANSAKNNRMTLQDVRTLINDEKNGEAVVSWHSKYIWDKLKYLVKTDVDALKLSKIMRENLHYVLITLSTISAAGYNDFLVKTFLHPEYAYYLPRIIGFDPKNGTYAKLKKVKGAKKQYKNNAKRYIRISIESLKHYKEKNNRKIKIMKSKEYSNELDKTISSLNNKDNSLAERHLKNSLEYLAEELLKRF
ncbi:hypothetical protein ACFL0L_00710 [Patescibacteria group bacterium]